MQRHVAAEVLHERHLVDEVVLRLLAVHGGVHLLVVDAVEAGRRLELLATRRDQGGEHRVVAVVGDQGLLGEIYVHPAHARRDGARAAARRGDGDQGAAHRAGRQLHRAPVEAHHRQAIVPPQRGRVAQREGERQRRLVRPDEAARREQPHPRRLQVAAARAAQPAAREQRVVDEEGEVVPGPLPLDHARRRVGGAVDARAARAHAAPAVARLRRRQARLAGERRAQEGEADRAVAAEPRPRALLRAVRHAPRHRHLVARANQADRVRLRVRPRVHPRFLDGDARLVGGNRRRLREPAQQHHQHDERAQRLLRRISATVASSLATTSTDPPSPPSRMSIPLT